MFVTLNVFYISYIIHCFICYIQVTLFYKSKPKSYLMTPRRRRICRLLARGSKSAFTRGCLKDGSFKKAITKGICTSLRREIALLTSDDVTSILLSKSSKVLNEFTWDGLLTEVKRVSPTLLSILQGCCKTKNLRKNQDAIVGILVAILCKHRRSTASLVQRLVSLILYSGHTSKKVYLI
jgi:hypothetical protein